jgi:hypothetical protein
MRGTENRKQPRKRSTMNKNAKRIDVGGASLRRVLLHTAVVSGLISPGGAHADTLLNIPADPVWSHTGIQLQSNDVVHITASGTWEWYGPGTAVGPDGTGAIALDLFLNDGQQGQLIAYVGRNPYQGRWGGSSFFPQPANAGYFAIGSSNQFTSSTSGELWLGINDDAQSMEVDDNPGFLTVDVYLNTNHAAQYQAPSVAPILENGYFSTNEAQVTFNFDAISTSFPGGGQCNTINEDWSPGGSFWNLYSSDDLIAWTNLGTLTLQYNNCTGMNPIQDTSVAGVTNRYYCLVNGTARSPIYGFFNTEVTNGYNALCNPLDADNNSVGSPTNDTVAELFSGVSAHPGGAALGNTVYYKTNAASNQNADTADYLSTNGSGWQAPDLQLPPGRGFLVQNPSNDYWLTFVGTVLEGSLTNSLVPGTGSANRYSLLGSQVPVSGYLQDLGVTSVNSDSANIWTLGGFFVSIDTYGWQPITGVSPAWPVDSTKGPWLPAGQCMLYGAGAGSTWTTNYNPTVP